MRLGAAVGAVWLLRWPGRAGLERAAAALAVLGLFGATLSEQTVLPLDEDRVGTWVLLAMVLLFALLAVRLRRQREMEAQIARLRQEQAEIWERDYRTLRRTYADQAKLYHDLHNHIEAIYHCLVEGQVEQAVQYCEDLRTPVRNMARTVWTGDTAIDCLINSKLALAGHTGVVLGLALAVTAASLAALRTADAYALLAAPHRLPARRGRGRGSVFVYLARYLAANKNYLVNTAGLCLLAFVLPRLFGAGAGLFPVGLGILCPDPAGPGRPVRPGVLPVSVRRQHAGGGAVSGRLAAGRRAARRGGPGAGVCAAKRDPVGGAGMAAPPPRLEDRERALAPSPQVPGPAGHAAVGRGGQRLAAVVRPAGGVAGGAVRGPALAHRAAEKLSRSRPPPVPKKTRRPGCPECPDSRGASP